MSILCAKEEIVNLKRRKLTRGLGIECYQNNQLMPTHQSSVVTLPILVQDLSVSAAHVPRTITGCASVTEPVAIARSDAGLWQPFNVEK